VFERFNESARQLVVLAQDEARALRHNYIGTEHILLGLLREEEGLAARVLESLGITLEEVRARVVGIVGQGDEVTTGQIPFTPRAKKVLELSLREALSLGYQYIGTEHILLGIVRENEGVAARILLDFDADAEKIREKIIDGPGSRQTDEGFWPEDSARDARLAELLHAALELLDETTGGSSRSHGSRIELGLRRVVPVAQQMSDGTWVVSVEVWDHGLVVRWATSERWPLRAPELHGWRVSDDVGTSYAQVVGSGGGSPQRGFRFHAEFAPAPPPEATSLRIRREATGDDLSISLTD
jgi:Clp amino terminal domain, pathogenicity island component